MAYGWIPAGRQAFAEPAKRIVTRRANGSRHAPSGYAHTCGVRAEHNDRELDVDLIEQVEDGPVRPSWAPRTVTIIVRAPARRAQRADRVTKWRGRPYPSMTRRSTLDVGQLLGDLAIADPQDVDATDVSATPIEGPTDNGAVAGADDLLDVEARER